MSHITDENAREEVKDVTPGAPDISLSLIGVTKSFGNMYPDVLERITKNTKDRNKQKQVNFLRAKYLSLTYYHWKNLFNHRL